MQQQHAFCLGRMQQRPLLHSLSGSRLCVLYRLPMQLRGISTTMLSPQHATDGSCCAHSQPGAPRRAGTQGACRPSIAGVDHGACTAHAPGSPQTTCQIPPHTRALRGLPAQLQLKGPAGARTQPKPLTHNTRKSLPRHAGSSPKSGACRGTLPWPSKAGSKPARRKDRSPTRAGA